MSGSPPRMKPMSNSGVVGRQGPPVHEVQKGPSGPPPGWGAPTSISSVMPVRRMISGVRRRLGIHKGLEALA